MGKGVLFPMWLLGFVHGIVYMLYFEPNGLYWQWFIFLALTYSVSYFTAIFINENH